MHENQKWVFQQCVKAYFFRKFADPKGGGGMGVPPPSFQLKKKAMKQDKDERKE